MSDTHVADGEVTPPPQENETETKARRLGWVPLEEFKGDPDKHRSAEEFLERGFNMLPLLQRDNDRLHRGMSRLEKRLEDQSRTFEEFQKFSEKAEERAYKRAKSELEAKRDSAIQNADTASAQQAIRELNALESDRPAPKTEPSKDNKPAPDPVFQDWMAENAWFTADPALQGYATKIFGQLEKTQPGVPPAQLLAETKKRVMDKFPEEFGINPRREAAAAVSTPSGGAAVSKKKGKTYEDLPAEAKRACDKFVKTIPGYTRDKYVADYEWDN